MKKLTFLDSIDVKTPCSESWDEMTGNEQIRFCSHCAKDVHKLTEMTRKQARKLVTKSEGGICIQYRRRPDGRIDTLKRQFHQITRNTGIAASVLGASLSISTLSYAQANPATPNSDSAEISQTDKKDSPNSVISGVVTDANGAVIPYAFVTLSNQNLNSYLSATANSEGFYEFKDVATGNYKLKIDAAGFASQELTQVSVGDGKEEIRNVQLSVQTVEEVVTVGGNDRADYGAGIGGVIAVSSPRNRMISAVLRDDIDEVKTRLANGEGPNVKDKGYGGNTPLHAAIENGNVEMVQVLLNAGAKINARNYEKQTPLMMLDEDATPELVNLLLRYRAKITAVDKEGNTPLMHVAAYGNEEVLQALVTAGSNVNAINKKGKTALMFAAENNEFENVKILLGSGANANARNRDRESALDLTSDSEVKQWLISYGATEN
jgi:Carboxypeptidase regulatory-like domain/Ankyrin repeats (3 copies)/Ankyrin repeats (many copies)